MTTPRVAKLADQITVVVAETLERRVKDPRLGFITITDVRLTGDSREATIFYTVMGDQSDREGTEAALRSATGMLRTTVGKNLGLRYAPSLTFVLDATMDSAAAIEDLLATARQRDAALQQESAGKTYAGEADPYRKDEDDPSRKDEDDTDEQA